VGNPAHLLTFLGENMAVEFMDFHKAEAENAKATKKMGFDFYKDHQEIAQEILMPPSLEELKQEEDKLKADQAKLQEEVEEFEEQKKKPGRPRKVAE
jgi:hypothetical protein